MTVLPLSPAELSHPHRDSQGAQPFFNAAPFIYIGLQPTSCIISHNYPGTIATLVAIKPCSCQRNVIRYFSLQCPKLSPIPPVSSSQGKCFWYTIYFFEPPPPPQQISGHFALPRSGFCLGCVSMVAGSGEREILLKKECWGGRRGRDTTMSGDTKSSERRECVCLFVAAVTVTAAMTDTLSKKLPSNSVCNVLPNQECVTGIASGYVISCLG